MADLSLPIEARSIAVEIDRRPKKVPLPASRIITEDLSSARNMQERFAIYGSEFSHQRSFQAFEDYKSQRDQMDMVRRTLELERRLSEAQYHRRSGEAKRIEQQIRENGSDLYGGEVIFYASDFKDAQIRLLELIGPSNKDLRKYRYCRFGDEAKGFREKGMNGPVNGFESVSEFESHGKMQRFSKSWRIDFDRLKGPHFNVAIRPASIVNGQAHFLDNNDPQSLNIAVLFPGDIQAYREDLHAVEISAITSFVSDDADELDYLPITTK